MRDKTFTAPFYNTNRPKRQPENTFRIESRAAENSTARQLSCKRLWLTEVVFQTELNQTSGNCRLGDSTKGRRRRNVYYRWEPEDWVVPQVEEFCPELKCVTLRNCEPLGHGEVPVLLERSTESIARHVPGRLWRGAGSKRNINSSSETGRIQVTLKTASYVASCIELVDGCAGSG